MAIKAGSSNPSTPQPLHHHTTAQPPRPEHCGQGRGKEKKGRPRRTPRTPERRRPPPPSSSPSPRRLPGTAPTRHGNATRQHCHHRYARDHLLRSPPSSREHRHGHRHKRTKAPFFASSCPSHTRAPHVSRTLGVGSTPDPAKPPRGTAGAPEHGRREHALAPALHTGERSKAPP